MVKFCSPFGPPRIIERSEKVDQGEMLVAALRAGEASGIYTATREGFDAKWTKDAMGHLKSILPMDFKDLNNYFVKMGWIAIDPAATKAAKATGIADAVYKGSKDVDKIGTAAAVTKVYLESVAGMTLQLAENFLRKVSAGEAATAEGMMFAQQMQHLSRFGGYVLGWHQSLGRGVRVQGLLDNAAKPGGNINALEESVDALGNLGQYQDKFQEIAAKLQDEMTAVDGVNELIALAQRVKFLGDPRKIAKVSMTMEVAGNAWTENMVNGLMSNPNTISTNLLGVIWVAARPMLQYGAAKTFAMATGSTTAQQAAVEAASALAAMRMAFGDAAQVGWHAARTETTLYQAGSGQELASRAGIHGQHIADFAERRGWEKPNDQFLDMITKMGQVVRLPSRALLGTDEFAKHLAIRGEIAARAVQNAAKQGVDFTDKKALGAFLDDEMKQAFDLHAPEVWEKYKVKSYYSLSTGVMAEADAATFQETNGLASHVSKVLNKAPMLRPFVPFVRTPLNILKQGFVESTGLGAVWNASKAIAGAGFNPTAAKLAITKQLLDDPGESFRIAGQIALTGTLAATMYSMAMSGQITAGGPGRWSKGGRSSAAQKAWEAMIREQGIVPYSVKIGNTSVPFDRFGEPISIVLRMFADMGAYSAYVNRESQEEWLAGMAAIMVSGLYQSTFLTGLNDFMDLASNPDAALGVKGGRMVQNWMATQTPFGGLLSYVDKVNDPYRHAYQGASFTEVMRVHEDTFGTGIFAKIADRIPGYSGTPALIDQITGEMVPQMPGHGPGGLNPLQMAIPVLPRGIKGADDVWTAVYNITGSYQERSPKGKLKLTHAEQQNLNRRMATQTIGGKTLREAILDFYNTAEVQAYVKNRGAAYSEVRTKIEEDFSRIIDTYYRPALRSVVESDPDLRQRDALAKASYHFAGMNDTQQAAAAESELDRLYREARMRGVF